MIACVWVFCLAISLIYVHIRPELIITCQNINHYFLGVCVRSDLNIRNTNTHNCTDRENFPSKSSPMPTVVNQFKWLMFYNVRYTPAKHIQIVQIWYYIPPSFQAEKNEYKVYICTLIFRNTTHFTFVSSFAYILLIRSMERKTRNQREIMIIHVHATDRFTFIHIAYIWLKQAAVVFPNR